MTDFAPMRCPKCSASISNSDAAFCSRCGNPLPVSVSLSAAPERGQRPDFAALVSTSTVPVEVVRAEPQLRGLKVAAIALATALVLTWVLWVSFNVNTIPDAGEVAFEAATRPGYPYPIGTLNIEQTRIAISAWELGVTLGLLAGAGVGWVLTRPKKTRDT